MKDVAFWACAVLLVSCAESRTTPPPDAGHDAGKVVLADDVAGTRCKKDSDCGVGRCATRLHIASETESMAAPGGYCTASCIDDSQCGDGDICSVPSGADSGECLAGCRKPGDCRDGYLCVGAGATFGVSFNGTCQPKPRTGRLADGVAGLSCAEDSDCEGGQCAVQSPVGKPFPDNYCTGRCLSDDACGLGGVCLVIPGSADAGYCYEACRADSDCARSGYRCVRVGEHVHGCYPSPDPLPDDTAGKACASDRDCGGAAGSCARELPYRNGAYEFAPAPGGYCTQECAYDSECGANARCISRGPEGGMCLARCQDASECREGYMCILHGRDLDPNDHVCMPFEI